MGIEVSGIPYTANPTVNEAKHYKTEFGEMGMKGRATESERRVVAAGFAHVTGEFHQPHSVTKVL